MDGSDVLRILSAGNRKLGHVEYADQLENSAAVYEACEVLREEENK